MATNEKNMKTFEECRQEVYEKYQERFLPREAIGSHVFYEEVANLYLKEGIKEELNANNEAHKSATRILIKEAMKLARENKGIDKIEEEAIHRYTESEILEKLKL